MHDSTTDIKQDVIRLKEAIDKSIVKDVINYYPDTITTLDDSLNRDKDLSNFLAKNKMFKMLIRIALFSSLILFIIALILKFSGGITDKHETIYMSLALIGVGLFGVVLLFSKKHTDLGKKEREIEEIASAEYLYHEFVSKYGKENCHIALSQVENKSCIVVMSYINDFQQNQIIRLKCQDTSYVKDLTIDVANKTLLVPMNSHLS